MGNEQGRKKNPYRQEAQGRQSSNKNPYRQEAQQGHHDHEPAAIPDHGHGHGGHGHGHGHCHDHDCTMHGGGSTFMIPTATSRYAVLDRYMRAPS